MRLRCLKIIAILFIVFVTIACQSGKKQYVIGVSQPMMDDWHRQFGKDVSQELKFYDIFDVQTLTAWGKISAQIKQIEQFIEMKVDVLVVLSTDSQALVEVVERAYDAGIHVIIIDNPIPTEKYTTFIGVDQERFGQGVFSHIRSAHPEPEGELRVLELFEESHPERSRRISRGVRSRADLYSRVKYVDSVWVNNSIEEAELRIDSLLRQHEGKISIFAHSEKIALAACNSVKRFGRKGEIDVWGVGALTGENNGIELVFNDILDVTFQYPTGGAEMLEVVNNILVYSQYERLRTLATPIVDDVSVRILKRQNYNTYKTNQKIQNLNLRNESSRHSTEMRIYLLIGLMLIVVAIFVVILRVRAKRSKDIVTKLEKERNAVMAATSEPLPPQEQKFIDRFNEIIERNIGNAEFEIESIGDELHYSRVQIYRKVKSITGKSPAKVLRNMRLRRADQLLRTTDKSISEIAFEVGFTTPSYFSKNYKDLYGVLPSSIKR